MMGHDQVVTSQFQVPVGQAFAGNPALTRLSAVEVVSSLVRWAQDVGSSPGRLDNLLAESIQHFNGFVKMPVTVSAPAESDHEIGQTGKMVVHAWLRRPEHIEEIHDHRWDFQSLVLTGSVFLTDYAVSSERTAQSVDVTEYLYGPVGNLECYQMVRTGPARLVPVREAVLTKGSYHANRHDVIHRVRVLDYPAITLFWQSAPRQTKSHVYLPVGDKPHNKQLTRVRQPANREDIHTIVDLIRAMHG